jgi:hypothetical protein
MPTIHIATEPLGAARRRAVTLRLTRWLRARGVAPAHVIVHFADLPPNTAFSGGMPVEALGTGAPALRCASVVCHLSPDRDAGFRAEFAAELAAALDAVPGTGFLQIEFRTTRPDHVFIWRDGALGRVDTMNGRAIP